MVFIYYPLIRAYFFPEEIYIAPGQPSISIPRIKAVAPLIWNIDPWHQEIYERALQKGVAHAQGSAAPGEGKTVFLFAHSSSLPWEITRYNTIFLRLNELQTDDVIKIKKEDKEYVYLVAEKKIVSPAEINYLTQQDRNQLIIQTCWPIGTDWQRLLIIAEPLQ